MRNKFLIVSFFSIVVFCSFDACNGKKDVEEGAKETLKDVKAPDFVSDSAYQYIQSQVNFGPRVPNSPSHKACGDYLVNKLKELKAEVSIQEFESTAFDGKKLKLKNIIGSYNPSSTKRILLAAHWDTRPFSEKDPENPTKPSDGAGDGASGVAVLLEVGRILAANPNHKVGVDIIFFDGEDYGDTVANKHETANNHETWCLGSQYWAKNRHKPNYSAYYGILLDMVGAKNAQFAKEEFSMKYAKGIVNDVWEKGIRLGYGQYFIEFEDGGITDDHRFVNEIAKIPMIDIIVLHPVEGFGSYHHTLKDNMAIIDKETLKAVGQTVLHVIYNEPGPEGS